MICVPKLVLKLMNTKIYSIFTYGCFYGRFSYFSISVIGTDPYPVFSIALKSQSSEEDDEEGKLCPLTHYQ